MSGRKRKKRKNVERAWWEAPWLAGLFLVVLAVYLGLCLTGPEVPWWAVLDGGELDNPLDIVNPGGPVGSVLAFGLRVAFGSLWSWVVVGLLFAYGVAATVGRVAALGPVTRRLAPLWIVSTAWVGQPDWPWTDAAAARLAGAPGAWAGRGTHALVGLWGGRLFLSLILLVVMLIVLRPILRPVGGWLQPVVAGLGRFLLAVVRMLVLPLVAAARFLGHRVTRGDGGRGATSRKRRRQAVARGSDPTEPVGDTEDAFAGETEAVKSRSIHWPEEPEPNVLDPEDEEADRSDDDADAEVDPGAELQPIPIPTGPLELPSISLLTEPAGESPELSSAELDAAADLLEETLRSFGVEGEVKDVRPGPVVTTYEYQPAAGIRINQIVQRANDLSLAMRARSLRMEAPIPGKAAVGIEIPNQESQIVTLREVLQADDGRTRKPLEITLGKDVQGFPITIDLAAQPHLLVAGSTGSGKSVCLNAMITNLLLYNDPSRVRFLLIDPKMLELNVYNGVPHLLMPVVTDPKEALRAMAWMVAQMEQRYRQLSKHAVRNIEQYNDKIERGEILTPDGEPVTEPMPYYVTIVDELADLMVQLGQDFEIPVTRLAQKARAVGLHLVLATQRPSVDVLTGVIKANIPCRIAFRVIQRNDSRTVLDQNGAEQLLGRGDMLYLMPGRATPVRVHGAFVDVPECEAIADHWRQYAGATREISLQAGGNGGTGVHTGEDELFEDAVRVVVSHDSGSTSLLQRRLRIGYTRAGRLMDMMEEAGIVGPFTGSKARDVLVKEADLPDLFGDENLDG